MRSRPAAPRAPRPARPVHPTPWGPHLVVSQLQRQLHERVRARPALLDQALPEGVEGKGVEVHVTGQEVRAAQGRLYHLLTLERKEGGSLSGGHAAAQAEDRRRPASAQRGRAAWTHTALSRKGPGEPQCDSDVPHPSLRSSGAPPAVRTRKDRWDPRGHFPQPLLFYAGHRGPILTEMKGHRCDRAMEKSLHAAERRAGNVRACDCDTLRSAARQDGEQLRGCQVWGGRAGGGTELSGAVRHTVEDTVQTHRTSSTKSRRYMGSLHLPFNFAVKPKLLYFKQILLK